MKKVRCKKEFGTWYYEKIYPNDYNCLDGVLYALYDETGEFVTHFCIYWHMKRYIETGEIIA